MEQGLHEKTLKQKTNDFLQIGTAFNGTVRLYITKTTKIVSDAKEIHDTYPTATAALGRLLTVTLIMGAMLKGDQTIAVKMEGDGPIERIICESDNSGRVMGYLGNGGVYLKYKNGKLAVGDAIGHNGTITVVKDLHLKEPFTTSIPIISGEIAEDFTYYFTVSEQVPSSVSLGVLVGLNGDVLSSGGFIVQVMPNCKEETIALLEENLKKVPPISELIAKDYSPREIAKSIVGDNEYTPLKTEPVRFACNCSKERYLKGIKSIGKGTILKLINEDHGAEVVCQYCHKKYQFTEDDLKKLITK